MVGLRKGRVRIVPVVGWAKPTRLVEQTRPRGLRPPYETGRGKGAKKKLCNAQLFVASDEAQFFDWSTSLFFAIHGT
jgi:hypothetical protein